MTSKATKIGLLVGAAAFVLPAIHSTPQASANTVIIQAADPLDAARVRIRNGIEVLRPTDEEHTPEQATFAFDPLQKDKGIVVMMSTGRLDGPAGPNLGDEIEVGNIQGACMPISLVQDASTDSGLSLIPDVANFKYVSQRNSDENRAYHHPEVEAIGNGMFAITANWDRNNETNTERYIQVVDSQCNLQQLTGNITRRENNTSGVIMAKNNDNCSGRQSGGGGSTFIAADGKTYIMSAELCNGNGRDDGWANYISVECAAGTCDVQKIFDTSFIDQEERSRGTCEQMDTDADGIPETSVCCGTEGNNQPQRDGVWCAGIDHATGDKLWKEQVAYRGETASGQRTYAMRIKMKAEKTIEGANTGKLVLQYQMHRGNNNDNKKGGYDDKIMMSYATPTRAGLGMAEPMDITNEVIKSQTEFTHATMFQTFTGTIDAPVTTFGFLSPNHNGGGGVNSSIMNVPVAGGAVMGSSVTNLSGPVDSQKYSKYLGNNPNNQGRNYTDCHVVQNPFATAIGAGGSAAGIPVINMCALTGKMTSAGVPAMKPDLFFEIWTSLEKPAVEEPGEEPTPEEPGDEQPGEEPGDEPGTGGTGDGTGDGTGSGFASSGGCSTTGSSSGGLGFLFLGLAMFAIRRRRSL